MTNLYQTLYDLICGVFYGEMTLTGWQEMTLTILATAGCIFVFAVPFIVVKKVIDVVFFR